MENKEVFKRIIELQPSDIIYINTMIDESGSTLVFAIEEEKSFKLLGFQNIRATFNFSKLEDLFSDLVVEELQKGVYQVKLKGQSALLVGLLNEEDEAYFECDMIPFVVKLEKEYVFIYAESYELSDQLDLNFLPGNYYIKSIENGNDSFFREGTYPS